MEEKYLMVLTQTEERSKTNAQNIVELKQDIKEVKEDQKSLLKIASSVEIIANNMQNLQEGLEEVKSGQQALNTTMNEQLVDVRREQNKLDEKIDDASKRIEDNKNAPAKTLWHWLKKLAEKAFIAAGYAGFAYLAVKIFGVKF